MIIDYSVQKTFMQSLDIVDAGNCCVRCTNDGGLEYYIMTKTLMGKVGIIKFGPVMPDAPILMEGFSVEFKKIDYKENLINKEITKYVNDPYKKISSMEECTEYEAWETFPSVKEAFENI